MKPEARGHDWLLLERLTSPSQPHLLEATCEVGITPKWGSWALESNNIRRGFTLPALDSVSDKLPP